MPSRIVVASASRRCVNLKWKSNGDIEETMKLSQSNNFQMELHTPGEVAMSHGIESYGPRSTGVVWGGAGTVLPSTADFARGLCLDVPARTDPHTSPGTDTWSRGHSLGTVVMEPTTPCTVSPNHFMIFAEHVGASEVAYVADLDSAAGTYMYDAGADAWNKIPPFQVTRVRKGDLVRVGETPCAPLEGGDSDSDQLVIEVLSVENVPALHPELVPPAPGGQLPEPGHRRSLSTGDAPDGEAMVVEFNRSMSPKKRGGAFSRGASTPPSPRPGSGKRGPTPSACDGGGALCCSGMMCIDANMPMSDRFLEETLTCNICLDVMLEPRVLSCGHSFCSGCIARYLIEKTNIVYATSPRARPRTGSGLALAPTPRRVVTNLFCPTCNTTIPHELPSINVTLRNICEEYIESHGIVGEHISSRRKLGHELVERFNRMLLPGDGQGVAATRHRSTDRPELGSLLGFPRWFVARVSQPSVMCSLCFCTLHRNDFILARIEEETDMSVASLVVCETCSFSVVLPQPSQRS